MMGDVMTGARLWVGIAAIAVFAAGSLAAAGLRLAWHWSGHTTVLPSDVMAPPAAEGAPQPRDITAIVAFAPFGQAETLTPDRVSASADTGLDVVLRGVMVDPDPGQSRALMLVGGNTSVFRVGDAVQSAELVMIDTETVTLQVGDRRQVVGFDGMVDAMTGDAATAPQDAAPAAPRDPLARLAASIVAGSGSIDLRDDTPPETTDDYIAFWRNRITQNPQAAMDRVGVELVENGYRIKDAPDIGVTMAGLRPGDVITRLNGTEVGDIDRDRKLYDDVAASGIARLEVMRDGKSLLLTFPLR